MLQSIKVRPFLLPAILKFFAHGTTYSLYAHASEQQQLLNCCSSPCTYDSLPLSLLPMHIYTIVLHCETVFFRLAIVY